MELLLLLLLIEIVDVVVFVVVMGGGELCEWEKKKKTNSFLEKRWMGLGGFKGDRKRNRDCKVIDQ